MAVANWPAAVPYRPDIDGWGNSLATPSMVPEVDGPNDEQRSKPGDRIEILQWQKALTRAQFALLRTFVAGTLRNGAAMFWMPVSLNRSSYEIRTVQIAPGSFAAAGIDNARVRVSMTLRVFPAIWVPPVPVITTISGATISGTAPAGASVEVLIGSLSLTTTATGGVWSVEPAILPGEYDLQARASASGVVGPWTALRRATIGFQALASALLARMTVQPSTARAAAINRLYVDLSLAGLLAKLDLLYVLAAHDAQAARLNWASASYALTVVGAPTFLVDRGYAGATNAWLATGYNPAVDGVRYTRNSAHLGAWSLTDRGPANMIPGGVSMNTSLQCGLMARAASGLAWINVNDQGAALGAVTRSDGLTLGSRLDGATRSNYRDATLLATASVASIAVPSCPLDLLTWNANGGASRLYWCTDRIAIFTMGAGLTSPEVAAFHGALQTYLQTVGAVA